MSYKTQDKIFLSKDQRRNLANSKPYPADLKFQIDLLYLKII